MHADIYNLYDFREKSNQCSCRNIKYVFGDADPSPWDLCVVAAVEKFTWTTEILWRKRDSMATL